MRPIPPTIGPLVAVVLALVARPVLAQFTDASAGLVEPSSPCVAWGDYDNDDDLDLLVAGDESTILYKNTAGVFAGSGISFTGLEFASAAWGDYDNDGDLDLAIIGQDSTNAAMTRVYRNEGGTSFVPTGGLMPFSLGNNAAAGGPGLDGWLSNMVIDESQTYTNLSGSPESVRIDTFNFYASADANPLTPFVVRINGDNDFTVLAVGSTRSDSDYDIGANSLPFSIGSSPVLVLAAGETIAVGFSDANADGSGGGAGAAIPFTFGGSEVWYSGGPGANDSGSVVASSPPAPGSFTFTQLSRTYHFNFGFSVLTGSFTDVAAGALAWGDYDNDGDLDLVVTGITAPAPGGTPETRLYRNDGGVFTSVAHPFPNVFLSAVAWGDYDGDGDLDLVITGATTMGLSGGLFRNDGGTFSISPDITGFNPTQAGFVKWGDYESDGDLDLLIGGSSLLGGITELYRNNAGALTDAGAALPDLLLSAADWGDYDNDGDFDVAINGFETFSATRMSRLYAQTGGGAFVDSMESFPNVESGVTAWGDYDNDGDLDLILGGQLTSPPAETHLLRLYENGSMTMNSAPGAPGNLTTLVDESTVTFNWDAATDDHTPSPALSYALRVGTTMGGSEIMSSGAAPNGFRRLPSPGNASHNLTLTLEGLAPGTYYWSVQSVDSSFLGSSFVAEASFTVTLSVLEVVSIAPEPVNKIRVTWLGSPGITYSVEASDDLTPASWIEIATPTADGMTGLFDILEDLSPPSRRYFRALRP